MSGAPSSPRGGAGPGPSGRPSLGRPGSRFHEPPAPSPWLAILSIGIAGLNWAQVVLLGSLETDIGSFVLFLILLCSLAFMVAAGVVAVALGWARGERPRWLLIVGAVAQSMALVAGALTIAG